MSIAARIQDIVNNISTITDEELAVCLLKIHEDVLALEMEQLQRFAAAALSSYINKPLEYINDDGEMEIRELDFDEVSSDAWNQAVSMLEVFDKYSYSSKVLYGY